MSSSAVMSCRVFFVIAGLQPFCEIERKMDDYGYPYAIIGEVVKGGGIGV